MKKIFDKSKIMEALVKRAEGFYYSEEISEFGVVELKDCEKSNEKKAESGEQVKSFDEVSSNNQNNLDQGVSENKDIKTSKKSVSKKLISENPIVYSSQKCELENKNLAEVKNENPKNLMLLKKKVTTHYVPPDMSAIKMLIENFGQEIKDKNEMLDDLSDDELLEMRSEIIKYLKDE